MKAFKLNSNATVPTRNLSTDAGADIYSAESVFIPVGSRALVSTGIALEVREGMVGKVEDRSSMARKGLRVGAGIIDTGYNGEVNIVLHNLSNTDHSSESGTRGYQINKGDRIAQLLLIPVIIEPIEEVAELWSSERGNKGFGSSGV